MVPFAVGRGSLRQTVAQEVDVSITENRTRSDRRLDGHRSGHYSRVAVKMNEKQ
jgi:hypothetical protein